MSVLPDLSKFAIRQPKSGDESVPRVIDDELAKLGWSNNARLSFVGDVGRENSWDRDTIFKGHIDPASNTNGHGIIKNRGIISWNGDRLTALNNSLQKQGVLGKNDDDELRGMVRFMDDEMRSSPEWKNIHSAVRNPNISTYDASENLRKYIKYNPGGKYNTPDPNFRVANNAKWATKAQGLGLGQLPDLSSFSVDSNLPDLSQFNLNGTETTAQPPVNGSIPTSAPGMTGPTPVPEHPDTIQAQMDSALDPKSPRAGVLTTEVEQNAQFSDAGWTPAQTPNGTLWVAPGKAKKLKLRNAKDLQLFVDKNKDAMTRLIGKVDNVDDTSQGMAVHTTAPDGTELTSSIVTNPESAQKQVAIDQASFPGSKSELIPAQGVIDKRMDGNLTASDFTDGHLDKVLATPGLTEQFPNSGLQPQAQGVKQGQRPAITAQGGHVDVSVGELTPEQMKVDDSRVSEVSNWKAGDKEQADDELLKGGDVFHVNLEGVDPKNKNSVAVRQIVSHLSQTYGVSADQILPHLDGFEQGDIAGNQSDVEITVPRDVIASFAGKDAVLNKIKEQRRAQIAPLYERERDTLVKRKGEDPKLEDVAGLKLDAAITPEELSNIMSTIGRQAGAPSGVVENLTAGALGSSSGIASTVGGILDFVNDLSPTKGESMAQALDAHLRVARPDDSFRDILKDVEGQGAQARERMGGKDWASQILKIAGGAPGDMSKLILVSTLPGGAISGMMLDSAAQTRSKGGTGEEIAKSALHGATLGALFSFAPTAGKAVDEGLATLFNSSGNTLIKEGATLATIGGGTYTLARATGSKPEEAWREAVVNSAFHLTNVAPQMLGKPIRVRDEQGNVATVKVEDGEMKVVEERPVAEIFAPANREAYFRKDAAIQGKVKTAELKGNVKVPATEPESERQYTSVLDEIRQNNARTTAQVQALFPDLKREEAADYRRQAWENAPEVTTKPETIKSNVVEDSKFKSSPEILAEPGKEPTTPESVPEAKKQTIGSEVSTEKGTKAKVQPKVIDASDILTSLDEGYPPELQPRDRSRAASKAQISRIANNLKPEFLDDSPKASDGRPLVVPIEVDGKTKYAVVSGNGRVEAIRHAYDLGNESGKAYAEFTTRKESHNLKNPVYVAELKDVADLPKFAREANESTTAQMSATERAKGDAEKLDANLLSRFVSSEDGSIHSAANREFIRDFIQKAVPENEQGALVDENGQLSQEGMARVRNAIFAKAFGEDAVHRLAESTDDNIKRVTNALLKIAPKVVDLKEHVDAGSRHPGLDISEDVAKALSKYSALRSEKTDVATYLKQQTLFGDDLSPLQKRILVEFDNHKLSSSAISGILNNYIALAHELGDPKQTQLFGEPIEANSSTIFREAVLQYERGKSFEAPQTSFFDQNKGRENQPETSTSSEGSKPEARAKERETDTKPETRQPEKETPKELDLFAKNKIVTSDRVAEIRAKLGLDTGKMQSGFTPEQFALYIELGAAHIEAGARSFAAFSKQMIGEGLDFAENELRKIYNGIQDKYGFEGMDAPETTGIKNKTVNAEREARNIPAREKPLRRSFGTNWDEAKTLLDKDPQAGRELVRDLKDTIRPLTDLEDAILTHEQLNRQQSHDQAVKDVNNAATDAERIAAQVRLVKTRDDVFDVYDVGSRGGTENARGLSARRMMIKNDYSLARMEARTRAEVNEGNPLDETQIAEVKAAHEKIADLEKKVSEYENQQKDIDVEHYFKQLLGDIKKEGGAAKQRGDTFISFADKQEAQALQRIRARGTQLKSGLDPTELADYAIVGAARIAKGVVKFADWSVQMAKDFGKSIEPYLEKIFDRANQFHDVNKKLFTDTEKTEATPAEIVKKAYAIKDDNLLTTDEDLKASRVLDPKLVYDLARAHVNQGVTGVDAVIKAVHNDLKDYHENLTERDVRDAFSGYGKVKFPSKAEDLKTLRELKRLAQLTSAIEDANTGLPPKKTGLQREKPTQSVRDKMKELQAAMREHGIETSAGDQLASTNQARITSLTNQIEDLERQIKTGQKPVKGVPAPTIPEVEALRAKRDALKAQLPPESPRQMSVGAKQGMYKASLEKQIGVLNKRIATGENPPKSQRVPTTPEIEKLKAQRDALKAQLPEVDRSISDAQKLATYKKAIQKRTADLQAKITKGDYERNVRKPLTLDREGMRLRAQHEQAKESFEKGVIEKKRGERTKAEKVKDFIVHWRREFVLSSPTSVVKLITAALETTAITPFEEAAGGVYGKIFPGLAKKAEVESGFNVAHEAEAIGDAFINVVSDVGSKLKTGRLDFEHTFGGAKVPEELTSYVGRLHGGLKTVPMRSAFKRSSLRLNKKAIEAGADPTDLDVQMRIGNISYRKSLEQVFLNENAAVKVFQRAMSYLKEPSKVTGEIPLAKTVLSGIAKFELPVVRVPTNIIARTFRAAFGLPLGGAKLAIAYAKGIENLKPEQADLIMKQLKQGSVGGIPMLLGFFLPNAFGGLYHEGDKKKDKKDIQYGEAEIFGVRIPKLVMHHPAFEAAQFGATIRKVMDARHKNWDKGLTPGLAAGVAGLIDEAPFMQEIKEVGGLTTERGREKFVGDTASSVVPAIVSWAARKFDTDSEGYLVSRKPKTVLDYFKQAVPGLRQQVPIRDEKEVKTPVDKYRKGDLSRGDALKEIKSDLDSGKITHEQSQTQKKALDVSETIEDLKKADAAKETDFPKLEEILKKLTEGDKEEAKAVMRTKIAGKDHDNSVKTNNEASQLRDLYLKYIENDVPLKVVPKKESKPGKPKK